MVCDQLEMALIWKRYNFKYPVYVVNFGVLAVNNLLEMYLFYSGRAKKLTATINFELGFRSDRYTLQLQDRPRSCAHHESEILGENRMQ